MPNPTIAIDLDEVLSPFVPDLMEWYNNHHKANLQLEQFTTYDFSKIWGGTLEESVLICDRFHRSRKIEDVQPLADSVKVLNLLKPQFKLVLVTSRPLEHFEYTHSWINHHFPSIFSDVVLCNHWTSVGKAIKKSEVCKQINAHYFIDDLPHYIEDVASCSIQSLLFGNYPWNRKAALPNNVHRVYGWNEVLDFFTAIKR